MYQSRNNRIDLFSTRLGPLGRGKRLPRRQKHGGRRQEIRKKEERQNSILPPGIRNKGHLRFPRPVSFRRDFYLCVKENRRRPKCVKILMGERREKRLRPGISEEKIIAHLTRQIRRSTTQQLMVANLPLLYTKPCGIL